MGFRLPVFPRDLNVSLQADRLASFGIIWPGLRIKTPKLPDLFLLALDKSADS